jgi:hypothetical protein
MTTQLDFTHDHYRRIMKAALEAGYSFAFFGDYDRLQSGDQRACFLRHDCDNDLVAAVQAAAIETDMGVVSTWFVMPRSAMYNLLAPTSRKLVGEILAGGHQLGLHFDASLYAQASDEKMREEVRRECQLLEDEFGQSINVVSFHQPDQRILSGGFDPGVMNTYDKVRLRDVFYYSDSNLNFREGCPSDLFASRRHRLIQLLLHPEWWTHDKIDMREKWARMLTNNITLARGSLLEREATYLFPHQIKVEDR